MNQKKPIGVKQIAKMAGVSIATVDRVLNNRTGVSPGTKQAISKIIEKYNYQPNLLARRLATKKNLKLATLIPAISKETDFWQGPLNGILQAESEIKPFGVDIEKYFFDLNDEKTFVALSKDILKSKVDGLLLAPSFIKRSKDFATLCNQKNISYVYMNSDVPDQENVSYIGPNLYSSGYLGGRLASFLVKKKEAILLLNISTVPDSFYHLLKKEEGFRSFFNEYGANPIIKSDITKTDYKSIKKELTSILNKEKIKLIFVTNSRVFYVAQFLKESGYDDISLIGYDFIGKNIDFLSEGSIDFLISQKPQEQAYRGIMSLYSKLVKKEPVPKIQYMPIDIITKENYQFYSN